MSAEDITSNSYRRSKAEAGRPLCPESYTAPNGFVFLCLLPLLHPGDHEHMVDGCGIKWAAGKLTQQTYRGTDDARMDFGRVPTSVDHPAHYGGADNPYEAIKVIEAWQLGFCLGNCLKYLCRAGKKGTSLDDLKKARWYLDRHIKNLEKP